MTTTETQPFSVLADVDLSDHEFGLFSRLIHEKAGINIQAHKKALVKGRLVKRLRSLGFKSFKQYYDYTVHDKTGDEITTMLDEISTNVTQFFREIHHFDFMRDEVIPELKSRVKNRSLDKVRVWSAACSSGEEVWSLIMTFLESFPEIADRDLMILGSDISTKVLALAEAGVYPNEKVDALQKVFKLRYFESAGDDKQRIKDTIRKHSLFRRINLLSKEFPFKNPLDVIFCRNVMIYFDKTTQQTLVSKFYNHLREGGYLFLGHSEGLTGVKHDFRYIQPSVYRKEA